MLFLCEPDESPMTHQFNSQHDTFYIKNNPPILGVNILTHVFNL